MRPGRGCAPARGRPKRSGADASAGATAGGSAGSDVGGAAATREPDRKKVYVGIYVDDFVFYLSDPAEEALFRAELSRRLNVDFMGDVDFFLGTAFTWKRHENGHLSVHLCQSAFAEYTAHRFGVDKMNRTPNMTPYRSAKRRSIKALSAC